MRLLNDTLSAATNATLLRQRSGTQSAGNVFDGPRLSKTDAGALDKAGQALEESFIKTLLETSEAFDVGEGAGASFTKDAFISAIAQAVADAPAGKDGTGLGLLKNMHVNDRGPDISPRHAPASGAADLASLLVGGHGRKTSGYGLRHDPFTGETKAHHGVDIGAKEGTPVTAAQGGQVVFAGERGGYGNTVEILSANGTKMRYAHLSAIAVQKGDAIGPGAQIGAVGSTGRSTGAHLHVEVSKGGVRLDPEQVLKKIQTRVERLHEHHRSPFAAPSNGGAR